MSDDDNNVRSIPPRPMIPQGPSYRTADQSSAEHGAQDIANQIQQKRMLEWRTAARRDAAQVLERARERAGFAQSNWSDLDADTLHAITDLLLKVQTQETPRA
jgi:hypothetical protein